MSHVQEIHLLMMVSIPNRNAYKVSAMNYIPTAISLIASSMPVGFPMGIGLTVGLILAPTLEAAPPMSCGGNFAQTGHRHLSSLSSLDVPTQSDGTHALTVAVDIVAAIVVTDPKLQR
jgi:hypothetical protein